MAPKRSKLSILTLRNQSTTPLSQKTSVSNSLRSNSSTANDPTGTLSRKKSLGASIRSLFPSRASGAPTPSTTRDSSVEAESRHSLTTVAAEPISHAVEVPGTTAVSETSSTVPAPTEGQDHVYPESHGKFQEEITRSQPQEAHHFEAEVKKEAKKGKEKETSESRIHIRSKASLAWTAIKIRAKLHHAGI